MKEIISKIKIEGESKFIPVGTKGVILEMLSEDVALVEFWLVEEGLVGGFSYDTANVKLDDLEYTN